MWIRSQEKNILIDVKCVFIDNYCNHNIIYGIPYSGVKQYLGAYSTYEKALKVMDIIQDKICDNQIIKSSLNFMNILDLQKVDMETLLKDYQNTIVFQMPQNSEAK